MPTEAVNAMTARQLEAGFPNRQTIDHEPASGRFLWFDPPGSGGPDVFGVVFQRDRDMAQFQIDFDARTGRVVDIRATR